MNLLFWRRRKILARGNEKIVVHYNALTGRWQKAKLFRAGWLIESTRDPKVLRRWITTD